MYCGKSIALILPARNEALSLPYVLAYVPSIIDCVIVVDNGSIDNTAAVARQHGAIVVSEERPGYGNACLAGIASLKAMPPDLVAFADADGSDDLAKLPLLIDDLINSHADLLIEKRIPSDPQALTLQQRFGNWLATCCICLLWGYAYHDLGPMRVIKWGRLLDLNMRDRNFGWTIEMQIKALKCGLRIKEYPVPYRKRYAGHSKISRTLRGTVLAGIKILWIIFREALWGFKPLFTSNPSKIT